MSVHDDLVFPIGELSRRTGVPVKTLRFWSDEGLVPPAGRTDGGYRLYDAAGAARVELVRSLRGLGLDLRTVRGIVDRPGSLPEVAAAHARALDAEIRILRLRRAVLRWVAVREGTDEEMRIMQDLASLSAAERQRIIDDFVDETFAGTPVPPFAAAMRHLPDLPDDPTASQVEAWVELGALVQDPGFRARVREMAVAGGADAGEGPEHRPELVLEHAGGALAAGIDPASGQGAEVLARIVGTDLTAAQRTALADRIETFSDLRVERYWALLGVLAGREPFPPQVPAFLWFAAALRAG